VRDLRDPQGLGETYLRVRDLGLPIEDAVQMTCSNYDSGPYISAPPSEHHLAGTTEVVHHLLTSHINLSDGAD
jgi:hypothetical protein